MSECIKYFENGGKSMPFMIKNDKIWDKIKETLNIKFHSKPVYE